MNIENEAKEITIPIRPVLTFTELTLQLEFVFATRDKEAIKKLLKIAYDNPKKLKGEVTIKDKLLLKNYLVKLEKK